jgi:hypothetical protein
MGGKLYALDVQDESSEDVENDAFEEYLDEIRDSAGSEVKH